MGYDRIMIKGDSQRTSDEKYTIRSSNWNNSHRLDR